MIPTDTKAMIGKKYGRWTVLAEEKTERYRKVLCKCECGVEKIKTASEIIRGRSKSCGCLGRELSSKHHKKYNFPGGLVKVFHNYKTLAERRNLSFELSMEQFHKLTIQTCHYCGKSPSSIVTKYHDGPFVYNGVDRVDNTIGYTLENNVTCCGICNEMKTSHTQKTFIEQVRLIYENTIHWNTQGAK